MVHIAVCISIFAVAFGINQKISLERSHRYMVSETTNVLNKMTEFIQEGSNFIFKGWCFAPDYYNAETVRCELILQDTETKEAVWAKMEKRPEIQPIEERYADGGDYSKGSFAGRVKMSKLQSGQVYELLARYTSEYLDEAGEKRKYVQVFSLDEFLYQGKLTGYNPETFAAPEIAGTALEKELEGARLFHYFPEGLWVYVNHGKMYYVLSDSFPLDSYPNSCMAVNWRATNLNRIPEDYQQYGGGNADFNFMDYCLEPLNCTGYKAAVRDIPSDYASFMSVGFFNRDGSEMIFTVTKQLKEP